MRVKVKRKGIGDRDQMDGNGNGYRDEASSSMLKNYGTLDGIVLRIEVDA